MTADEWLSQWAAIESPARVVDRLENSLPSDAAELLAVADRLDLLAARNEAVLVVGSSLMKHAASSADLRSAGESAALTIQRRLAELARTRRHPDLVHHSHLPREAMFRAAVPLGVGNLDGSIRPTMSPGLECLYLSRLPAGHELHAEFTSWTLPRTSGGEPFVILGYAGREFFHLPTARKMTDAEVKRQADERALVEQRQAMERAKNAEIAARPRTMTNDELSRKVAQLEKQLAGAK